MKETDDGDGDGDGEDEEPEDSVGGDNFASAVAKVNHSLPVSSEETYCSSEGI